jgi:hypothetical protein
MLSDVVNEYLGSLQELTRAKKANKLFSGMRLHGQPFGSNIPITNAPFRDSIASWKYY